jgi:hypothetical protein
MPKKSDLPEAVRHFIIDRLAVYDPPSTVVAELRKHHKIDLSRQTIEAYDPTKKQGGHLAAKLRERFYQTRKAFEADTASIPIANRSVRLRALDRMERRFEEMGNLLAAAQLLEQAAKEVGGVYVGRGGAVATPEPEGPRVPQDLPADHLAEISARFDKGLAVIQGGKK